MRHAIVCSLLLLAATPTTSHSAADPGRGALQPAFEALHITEILAGPARDWDGSGTFSTRDDEWIEVRNAGTTEIDASAYFLTDGDSIPRFRFGGTIPAGERVVVTGRASYDWERGNGFPAFGLSLANTGDAVMLWQIAGAETLLVDQYAYRSHEAAADRATGRLDDGGEWALFDGLNPYTGTTPPLGTSCPPTPDAANACGTTPARVASWGQLKTRYR